MMRSDQRMVALNHLRDLVPEVFVDMLLFLFIKRLWIYSGSV